MSALRVFVAGLLLAVLGGALGGLFAAALLGVL